jgi:outer membrane lipoprotein-sorting protein
MTAGRGLATCVALLIGLAPARAQLATEIVQQHAARTGDRLAALTSIRAEGRTIVGDEVTPILILAERPNRLRVETVSPRQRVIQGYDGTNPPWITQSDVAAGAARDLEGTAGRDFVADADFDGPLLAAANKESSIDYAGEDIVAGRRALKLLVMSARDEIFFLWVDAESHEVVKRLLYRSQGGRRVAIETHFSDFRPVGGVPQPHRIETSADGRLIYVMVIDRMDANPVIAPAAFVRP